MTIISKYGKSISDMLTIKQDFFSRNDELLADNNALAKTYAKGARRLECKLCNAKLPAEVYFSSHGLDYRLCQCGHLNGEYVDDKAFSNALYPANYGKLYKEADIRAFTARVDAIYMPKARFLLDSLKALGVDAKSFKYLDVGAGSGYMVNALKRCVGGGERD